MMDNQVISSLMINAVGELGAGLHSLISPTNIVWFHVLTYGAGSPAAHLWSFAVFALAALCFYSIQLVKSTKNSQFALPALVAMMTYHLGLIIFTTYKLLVWVPVDSDKYVTNVELGFVSFTMNSLVAMVLTVVAHTGLFWTTYKGYIAANRSLKHKSK